MKTRVYFTCQIGRTRIAVEKRGGHGVPVEIRIWRVDVADLQWLAVGRRTWMLRGKA